MIEMNLTADPANPLQNLLEILIKAPAAHEPTPIPDVKIPTLIYIDDTIETDQLPIITHALTDTINRVTWPEQIRIISSKHELPDHLKIEKLAIQDIFQEARDLGECNLIVLTNDKTKELKHPVAQSSEFLTVTHAIQPTAIIELIDNLNDYVKQLKQKTIVNLKLEIELPNEFEALEIIDYLPKITKAGGKYFAYLIDLASEEEKAYAFYTNSSEIKIRYHYDDLSLLRTITGGQNLTF